MSRLTPLELQLLTTLEAAEEMVEYYHDHEGCSYTLKDVRKAIAAGNKKLEKSKT